MSENFADKNMFSDRPRKRETRALDHSTAKALKYDQNLEDRNVGFAPDVRATPVNSQVQGFSGKRPGYFTLLISKMERLGSHYIFH